MFFAFPSPQLTAYARMPWSVITGRSRYDGRKSTFHETAAIGTSNRYQSSLIGLSQVPERSSE